MPPATIDEYLAGVPDDQRGALGRLRAQIHAAAPDAIETIAYGMPGFKLDGRYFVGFSASKAHCSFYTGRAPVLAFADELKGYRTWKGTINFRSDQPLPADLVAKLIETRIAEHRAG
ncbi:MAG: iron chaperone [Candidatus Limnocylindrales bacterium]